MRLAAVLLVVLTGLAAAAPPPEVAALQKHVHQVIDGAEPSIACVLVSRSEHYADFRQGPSAAAEGRLGDFRAPTTTRFVDAAHRELVRRLDLARPDGVPDAYGSGVVIDDRGLVLTNYHVIGDFERDAARVFATKVYVRLPGAGRGSYADILAADPRADLAVLKMLQPPGDLKPIPIGDGGKVRKGDWIVTLANPFAAGFRDGSPSAAWGMVSNLRRQAPGPPSETERIKPLAQYGTLLQTDARTNVGCSGGAVLNLDGELVGLTTALAAIAGGETAGGYAIPTDANTRKMIDVLRRGEEIEYGFLGVTVNPEDRGDGRGVLIQEAAPGMPAARAGLAARDVVTVIDGNPVRQQDDLFLNIAAALAGSKVEIKVLRNGSPVTFTPTLGKARPTGRFAEGAIAANRPKPVHGLRVDYTSTLSIDTNPPEGVLVAQLEPGSPAEKQFKRDVDRGARLIITAVDGQPVTTPAKFYQLAGGKSSVTLDVVEVGSDSARRKVTLP
jgi:S1-C subfamily serine protease